MGLCILLVFVLGGSFLLFLGVCFYAAFGGNSKKAKAKAIVRIAAIEEEGRQFRTLRTQGAVFEQRETERR